MRRRARVICGGLLLFVFGLLVSGPVATAQGFGSSSAPDASAQNAALKSYYKKVEEAVAQTWVNYSKHKVDSPMSVKMLFYVTPAGKVQGLKVDSPDPATLLVNVSTKAILTAKIPPIPAELVPLLEDGRLEITITFALYPGEDKSAKGTATPASH